MGVPLLDIKVMHQPFRQELLDKLVEVLDSASYINGPYVEAFESQLAEYCGAKHAIGVTSGSDALIISLMALGIEPGDEIITTPFTFFATAGAIARVGATSVFIDIEPDTFNLDPQKLAAAIGPKTKGIIPVSLYGQTANMDAIIEIAEQHHLWVIEDAAQSIGAKYNGRMSGSFPLAGTYSFFPAKNLGAIGDAGAVMTDDDNFAQQLRTMRNHGGQNQYFYERVGGNFRLDAIQAAVLSVKLPYLKVWEEVRRKNAAFYDDAFGDFSDLGRPVQAANCHHVYNQYVLRVLDGKRDQYVERLKKAQVSYAIYYPLCLHQQACFSGLGYKTGDFPIAEKAADEVLAIPIMTDRAEQVVAALVGEQR